MDRDLFHLPGNHYLISHSVGAQPRSYGAALKSAYSDQWQYAGGDAWPSWFETLDAFRAGLAPLIGADTKDICPQANVSSAVTKILLSLPVNPKRTKIVLSEDDFPSVGFALEYAKQSGLTLEFLPGGEQLADLGAWEPAFAENVHLVLVTHVFSNTSVMTPCREIAERARANGVYSIIDIAQAVGSVPIDLSAWRPDFAVGTSLKYLCGGTGAAFLWANSDTAQNCTPRDVGWFSHANPFEFDIRHFEYANGVERFMGGTPSIAPFAGAMAGQALIAQHGIEAIYTHNQRLLSYLFDQIPSEKIVSMRKEGARGSGALIKANKLEAASKALTRAGIAHDTRLSALRISVHLYNDESDIDALVRTVTPYL